jgi:hypothetical protein
LGGDDAERWKVMGTNYYHIKDKCPHCGRHDEPLHIGKSSGGWTFSFHGTEQIRSYKDWLSQLSIGTIQDEYGDEISLEEFKKFVESKRGEPWNHARDVGVPGSAYSVAMKEKYGDSCESRRPDGMEWLDDEGNSFSYGEFS